MRGKMYLYKPYLRTAFLNNVFTERLEYLEIPSDLNRDSLQADIRNGARQFEQLLPLLDKAKEARYILIMADSQEQGYMAVTYLAAGFNHIRGLTDEEADVDRDAETGRGIYRDENGCEHWKESAFKIPIINEMELRQQAARNADPFSLFPSGNVFMQGTQVPMNHKPYWMDCTENSVCIRFSDYGMCIPLFSENDEERKLQNALSYFDGNDKVYLLNVRRESCNWEDSEEIQRGDRLRWNSIILRMSADEIEVALQEEWSRQYYGQILRSVLKAKNIKPARGFAYEKIVNLILAMEDRDKCRLTEDVVNYAIKDWGAADTRCLREKDFAFMDRFCRMQSLGKVLKSERKSAMEKLMTELIGLEEVKKQVLSIVNVMKYNRIRMSMNLCGSTYHNVHVMLGAPGTAKTTVAQLMGQIMVEEKLLPDNRFVCVNGAELKGMYVGHSAPKTKELFENNDIIVIDEAYSLVSGSGEDDSFSREAIAQLIIEIEKHSTDKLVIFAGYGGRNMTGKNNKMKAFMDANPGIKSRITSTIYFDSYSAGEMADIFLCIAKNQGYIAEEGTRELVEDYFRKRIRDENFGNGREARNLLENTVLFAACRVLKEGKSKYTKKEMQTILLSDIAATVAQEERALESLEQRKLIGFM